VSRKSNGLNITSVEVEPHINRFLGFVEKKSEESCWYRPTRARENGYTTITFNGKRVQAHRFSYAAFRGDVPSDKEIDHLCKDRACVNPEHLELVSRKENVNRRDAIYSLDDSSQNPFERIMRRVIKNRNSCWIWNGGLVRGYGVISIAGKTNYVHRIVFEHYFADFDKTMTIDHLCRNPRCVNPKHLEPVTRVENIKRMNKAQPNQRCRQGHYYAEHGKNRRGQCAKCFEINRKKRFGDLVSPYKSKRENIETHCAKGHEYRLVGRFKTGGCRQCQAQKDFARGKRKVTLVSEQYCPLLHDTFFTGRSGSGHCKGCLSVGVCKNGHDASVVGLTSKNQCKRCVEDRRSRYAVKVQSRQYCPHGHDTFVLGRNDAGKCLECARIYAREKNGYKYTAEELKKICKNGHLRTPENTQQKTKKINKEVRSYQECTICDRERKARYARKFKG